MITWRRYTFTIGCGLAVLALAASTPARAETVLEAVIDGASAGTPSPATGFATVVLDDAQTEASYEITYSGLIGAEVAAHFHNAPPGENGPVVFPLEVGSPIIGTWPIAPEHVAELLAGNIYVNIHTDEYPAGEIRGNLEVVSVASDASSWSSIKAIFR